jgi:hypothetical protein
MKIWVLELLQLCYTSQRHLSLTVQDTCLFFYNINAVIRVKIKNQKNMKVRSCPEVLPEATWDHGTEWE